MAAQACEAVLSGNQLGRVMAMIAKAVDIQNHRQLFVDDFLVAHSEDVVWQVARARKHPANPLVVPDQPWEQPAVYLYGTVVDTGALFQMWYQVQGPWANGGHETFICYAESEDGLEWHKPAVGLELEDGRRSNVLHVGEIGTVAYLPQEVGPRRYAMTYFSPSQPRGYRVLCSADGVDWTSIARRPLFSDYGDVGNLVWDALGEQYLLLIKPRRVPAAGGPRRAVALTRSLDLIEWSLPELILSPGRQDDALAGEHIAAVGELLEFDDPSYYRSHFYGMGLLPYEGLYLGLLWVFDASARHPGGNEDGPMHVQLVCSRDLKAWTRCGQREPFIALGEPGAWDGGMVQTASQPVVVGDEIWIYYGGWRVTHGYRWFWDRHAPPEQRLAGIGLAVVPRDRFVAVTPAGGRGSVTTVPLVWSAGSLWVNADCGQGQLRAEILDPATGRPLEGFSAAESATLDRDSAGWELMWGEENASGLAGRCIQIRFLLSGQCKLYSFWVQ